MNNEDDEKFNNLIADLLDEDELKLLKRIVKNKGEFEEENDV